MNPLPTVRDAAGSALHWGFGLANWSCTRSTEHIPKPAIVGFLKVDISRDEQRVLHALAQGGSIVPVKNPNGRIVGVECFNRDGWLLNQCTLLLFKKLKRKQAVASMDGRPYRITRRGLELVRSEVDNR